jgi:mannose-6-phosphate isomerase-like protein (cupin superfamily)
MGRRIVTANNAASRSYILSDEVVADSEKWRTWSEAPLGLAPETVLPASSPDLEPPAGGSRATFVTLPPWADMRDEVAGGGFHGLDKDGFHRTRTIDYIMIVAGAVELVLDDARTMVRAGDIVVQRNTNHAWYNHGDEPVLFWGVMISAL